ncbi:hypothetical protein B4923_04250 [Brenneria roseae subsp. americana]|uniref:Uncharacterized protein n=1 Tax=Brenneria roseae subsp. americana TaxID=1508507 RepID=A0A2U1TXK2_9GAMM|nr:hypothetical protein [Brenneria roseae]PWC14131.1 hypothetical protein B4923_04250 [Brenneria roseae subsp. americana]
MEITNETALAGMPPSLSREENRPVGDRLLYGVAYYDEYLPYDRLDEDIRMVNAVDINVVGIAESIWAHWK